MQVTHVRYKLEVWGVECAEKGQPKHVCGYTYTLAHMTISYRPNTNRVTLNPHMPPTFREFQR